MKTYFIPKDYWYTQQRLVRHSFNLSVETCVEHGPRMLINVHFSYSLNGSLIMPAVTCLWTGINVIVQQ